MGRFNRLLRRRAGPASPVWTSPAATAATHEGGPGHRRDPKSELFLLAVTSLAGEDTFYESAADRDDRLRALVRTVAVDDGDWVARLVPWLRDAVHLRSVALVLAAEAVRARLDAGVAGGNRQLVAAALRRADEPGEMLAYWSARHGRSLPKPVRRGVADAVRRLYDERALLKYDSAAHGFRFADVLELTHPAPVDARQGALFAHAIDRRHGRDRAVPDALAVLRRRAELAALPVSARRSLLDRPDAPAVLRAAGMTWEALAGWLQGPMDATAWQAVLPAMGYMARLRNLRNLDEAGVPDEVAATVAAGLADPAAVARSRQLPLRFLSAHRAAPSLRWGHALETALQHSLAGVPSLPGRTLVLVDRSVSMFSSHLSAGSRLTRADAAAVFGTALAVRAARADLVQFGTGSAPVPFRPREAVLRILDRFGQLGGTNTAEAVRRHYRGHDRVVILTDEQVWGGPRGADPTGQVPAAVPVYTWNLAGYRHGHGPSGSGNRHTFGGLTDAAFAAIPLLESGRDARWPF